MSAQAKEDFPAPREGSDEARHHIGQLQLVSAVLGEMPAPESLAADFDYSDKRFDMPARKFELAGDPNHQPRLEVFAPAVDWGVEDRYLASLAIDYL